MLISPGRAMATLFPAQFERLRHELHNSLIDFQNGLQATQGRLLSLNVWSRDGEMIARIELPGCEPEQLQVDIHENTVRIVTRLPGEDEQAQAGTWLQRERAHAGSGTQRELQLPFAIDAERSTATYDKGILELHLFSQAAVGQVSLPIQRRSE